MLVHGWILELASLNQYGAKIVNIFHLGNLLIEFYHAVQFWLDFRMIQIPV